MNQFALPHKLMRNTTQQCAVLQYQSVYSEEERKGLVKGLNIEKLMAAHILHVKQNARAFVWQIKTFNNIPVGGQ